MIEYEGGRNKRVGGTPSRIFVSPLEQRMVGWWRLCNRRGDTVRDFKVEGIQGQHVIVLDDDSKVGRKQFDEMTKAGLLRRI